MNEILLLQFMTLLFFKDSSCNLDPGPIPDSGQQFSIDLHN